MPTAENLSAVLSGFTERVSHLREDLTRKLMMWSRAGANMADSLREDGDHHRKNYGSRCPRTLPPLRGLLKRFSAAGTKPFRVGRLALCLGSLLILAAPRAGTNPVRGGGGGGVTLVPVITTVAGNGTTGYGGDGGPATSAELWNPGGVAVDSAGNLYIADNGNSRIRVVNTHSSSITIAGVTIPAGDIATVAGNGTGGYSGDSGPATSAELYGPTGVAVDSTGNIYIADTYNNRIREVNTSGTITTVAGNGTGGYSGDGGLAISAELNAPTGVALDDTGNLFIVDFGNQRIREVFTSDAISRKTGTITTVAGNGTAGYSGDNGPATSAELWGPFDVAVDSAGNIYIADSNNARIRVVNTQSSSITIAGVTIPAGDIATVAGNGTAGYSGDNGPATSAELKGPQALALDSGGNLYIGDVGNQRVRRVSTQVGLGSVSLGQSSPTFSIAFSFTATVQVGSVAVLTQGASGQDFQLVASTCAGSNSAGSSCTVNVTFSPLVPGVRSGAVVLYGTATPANAVATVYISGTGVSPAIDFGPGIISTVAGDGTVGYGGDSGPAASAELDEPTDVAFDGTGDLYIADDLNQRIRQVTPAGIITTVAGNGTAGYSGDNGPATSAELNVPYGVVVDGAGNLYIGDTYNHRIREVTPGGIISTVAGNGTAGYNGDNISATSAELYYPNAVAVDSAANLYIADTHNNRIREVSAATGVITTVAGNGTAGYSGDGGPATSAELNDASGVALDAAGNLYIADYLNNRVRMVSAATGVITTVAGTGTAGYSGDGGPAASAELNTPHDVVVDAAGNLYIADWGNNCVRRVNAATGLITTVVGTGTAVYNGDNIVATSADLNPLGMVFDNAGNLYIADDSNARIRKVDVSDPPSLTFSTTNVGSVSAAQDVIVENLGNAALDISQISTAANFNLGGADTTCSSSSQVLAPAASCILGIEFAPSTAGPISGNVMLTDNALNVSGASQQIPLSGTGQSAITSYTLSLTELGTGTGTVTDNSSPTPLINCSESNGTVTGTCSASYPIGSTVILTASPNSSPAFQGWGGACTVTASNQCSVVMNAAESVTADFATTYTLTLKELGTGAGTVTDNSSPPLINCSESNGVVTGTCSASYASGTTVTLTETLTSPSTFLGWGGACSGVPNTTSTCSVVMNMNESVSADFVTPNTTTVTVPTGTNVTAMVAYACPSNPNPSPTNPCTDPDGYAVSLTFPVVTTSFDLTFETIEFQATGFCPPGGSPSSDPDCRFVDFFDYGTDPNGNTIVPLSVPYANGNSVHHLVYSGTPGTAPPTTSYTGPVYEQISYNNGTFVPGAYWTGSTPRMLVDPDEEEFGSTVPYGTNCSTQMLVNGSPTSPPIYCQFDEDITTFYNSTKGVDATVGGKTKQTSDFVVVFLPTSTGSKPVEMPATPAAPTMTSSCINGCVINSTGTSITFSEGTGGTFALTPTGFPAPTLTESGTLPNGLTFNAATGLISGTPEDGTAGSYPITLTAANGVLPNDVLNYTLTVSTAPLTITASSATMTYGGAVPTITASYSGFVNGDTASNLTMQPTCATTATSTSSPGTYPSSCSGAVDPNYTFTYVNGTVTVVASALEISPTSVNFGTLYLGQAGVAGITLKNTGTTAITISSVKVTMPGNAVADYGSITFCPPAISRMPGTLGAGKSCVIGVGILATQKIFSPTASTATLTITDTAAGSPQLLSLSAIVINPQATLSATSLSFSTQKVGTTSAAKTVTLTNTGNTPLSLTSVTISGNFTLASGTTCSGKGSVAAGSSCVISVTFTPKAKGRSNGSVTIKDNALSSPQSIALSGTGD